MLLRRKVNRKGELAKQREQFVFLLKREQSLVLQMADEEHKLGELEGEVERLRSRIDSEDLQVQAAAAAVATAQSGLEAMRARVTACPRAIPPA